MIFRYLLMFAGIVMMITGCNSLVSQQFGTHRLRTIPLETVEGSGVGDADFVEIANAQLGTPFIVGPALRSTDKDYVLRPVFSAGQQAAWAAGETVAVSLVAWTETEDPDCTTPPGCLPPSDLPLRGLVSPPTEKKNPVGEWTAQRIKLRPNVVYLQLYEQPMAWYWNLLLLLGGLALAIVPEAIRFQRRSRDLPPPRA
ncbi:hypothetical protein QWY85_05655 [Neolewinella lacunae]|uniref:Uncharacterized protein n=1 Tax=Neolewinella lacunae TaxID=1517758 RepID=A0A923T943_9BACT|nr:hypothetical protein [Neolewinella lacunae]MBC6995186.1 hypothetical protein [Neolewinella lacunae]MDN3634136.1 hypothetical protein [Neolewinella lacunae]